MTTIDGTPGRWRPWLPGTTQGPAEDLAAAWGCTVPEAVAQAVLDAHAKLPTPVDAGEPCPGSPGVDPGQGTTRLPAPTTFLHPLPHAHLGGPCLFGDRCAR